ncbi:MAG: hypothetical protein R3E68_01930 [Burkholderiaceae bacterium]
MLYAPFGNSVFVIESRDDDKNGAGQVLRQQFVRLGEARGDFVNVLDGLAGREGCQLWGVQAALRDAGGHRQPAGAHARTESQTGQLLSADA